MGSTGFAVSTAPTVPNHCLTTPPSACKETHIATPSAVPELHRVAPHHEDTSFSVESAAHSAEWNGNRPAFSKKNREEDPSDLRCGSEAPGWVTQLRTLVRTSRETGESGGGRLVSCGIVLAGGRVVHGVNFAVHRALTPTALSKRMLHGCAEHNAVAATLAQGLSAESIQHIAIYAECRADHADKPTLPCLHCARIIRAIADNITPKALLQVHLISPDVNQKEAFISKQKVCKEGLSRLDHDRIRISAWLMGV